MKKIVLLNESYVPKVSICIPVRNGAQFIEQAISSALQQSYPDFELVIVDNCSTDDTATLVCNMGLRDSRIRFYSNDHDVGLVANLNRCLQYARGDYIKFLMADDTLLPGCLDLMVRVLDEQPSIILVVGARLIVDERGKTLALRSYSAKRGVRSGKDVIHKCLSGGNYIGEPTAVMFRRRDVDKGFNEAFMQLTDLEMWFQLLERGNLLSMPEPLSAIRRHAGQLSNANEKSDVLVEDSVNLFEQYRCRPYIRWTFLHVVRYKLRMASRLWRSRRYLSDDRRRFLIRNHSSRLAYYGYAPWVSPVLYIWRLAKGNRRN